MSSGATYTPGSWLVLVSSSSVALVDPALPGSCLELLWRAVRDGSGVNPMLDAIGQWQPATPPVFAVATLDGSSVHVVASGNVQVTAQLVDGRERHVAGASRREDRLAVGDTLWLVRPGERSDGVGLPIGLGVVLGDVIAWRPAAPARRANRGAGEQRVAIGAGGRRSAGLTSHPRRRYGAADWSSSPHLAGDSEHSPGVGIDTAVPDVRVVSSPPAVPPAPRPEPAPAAPAAAAAALATPTAPTAAAAPASAAPATPTAPTVLTRRPTLPKAPAPEARPMPSAASTPAPPAARPAAPARPETAPAGAPAPAAAAPATAAAPPTSPTPSARRATTAPTPAGTPQPTRTPQPAQPAQPSAAGRASAAGADAQTSSGSAAGVLVFADGSKIVIDGPVIIGRSPTQTDTDRPGRLITVRGEGRGVSRNHLRIDVGTDGAFAVDLGSRNGSAVITPSGERVALQAWLPYRLETGCRLTVADLTCEFRSA